MEMVISNKADLRKLSQFQAQGRDMALSPDQIRGGRDFLTSAPEYGFTLA